MRQRIIDAFSHTFINDPDVFAFWLEGADANGAVDDYSDLDIWLDVVDGKMPAIYQKIHTLLTQLSPIDQCYDVHGNDIIQHKVFHLAGTSEHLILDVCLQAHSRDFNFILDDHIECPKVIFDKADVISFKPVDQKTLRQTQLKRLDYLEQWFSHRSVRKYMARGEFLEAMAYYQRYVLQPLVEVLRMRHTPLHPEYGLVHISRHLPPAIVGQLEALHQIASLVDLGENILKAEKLFKENIAFMRE